MCYALFMSDVYEEIIGAFGGSATALAAALGEPNVATVMNWRTRGIPARKARAIERLTGISVQRIRPDDWRDYWPPEGTAVDLRLPAKAT